MFEPTEFAGRQYSAGSSTITAVGARYADVQLLEPESHQPDLWRTGGVIHRWGAETPQVVVFGSSHALMYGKLIDELCRERRLTVAFLSVDATSALIPSVSANDAVFPTPATLREFDAKRIEFVRAWRPDVLLVIDEWAHQAREPDVFRTQLREFVSTFTPLTRRIVFAEQVPTLPVGETINLREYVAWHRRMLGNDPVLRPGGDEALRQRANSMLSSEAGGAYVLPISECFLDSDGEVRWREGRVSLYADDDHLSSAGARLTRDLFREALK